MKANLKISAQLFGAGILLGAGGAVGVLLASAITNLIVGMLA